MTKFIRVLRVILIALGFLLVGVSVANALSAGDSSASGTLNQSWSCIVPDPDRAETDCITTGGSFGVNGESPLDESVPFALGGIGLLLTAIALTPSTHGSKTTSEAGDVAQSTAVG